MNEVLKAIEKRSSTRGYTCEKLTREELDILVRAGLQAPTATNRRELHITVVDGDNPILAEIEAEKNRGFGIESPEFNFYYSAPAVLFLSAEEAFPWSKVDAGIAVENIAIAAESMGLGNVIIGVVKNALSGDKKAYFAEALNIPESYDFEIAIAVGHKAVSKEPHEYDVEKDVSYI
ncbi:MAG: nitroreductase family protein [Oscillospiraceae bacterium]|nr:nitroreductase family protein [Oscillospiraceae bacterium]